MATRDEKGIAKFWSWWKTAKPRLEKAIEKRELGALEADITKHVRGIDPGLKWELGPGDGKKLGFALVWDGDVARRRVTGRWLAAAPRDKTWDFFPARPAGHGWKDLVLEVGPHKVALADFVCDFDLDDKIERVHAKIFHKGLVKAPENVRATATFVMLDRAFGEDGVERWLGEIELAKSKPKDAKPIGDLVKAIGKLAKKRKGSLFALYQGTRDDAPIFVMTDESLKLIDHLECDTEISIAIEMSETSEAGLPTKQESIALDALENGLIDAFGDDAAFHGRETHGGKRTLFFFAPAEGRAVKHLTAWKKKQKRTIAVKTTPDPTWEGLRRWS